MGEVALKEAYPRLHNITTQKTNEGESFMELVGGKWVWNLLFRRIPINNEITLPKSLLNAVDAILISLEEKDGRIWVIQVANSERNSFFFNCAKNECSLSSSDSLQIFSPTWSQGICWTTPSNQVLTIDHIKSRNLSVFNICFMVWVDWKSINHLFVISYLIFGALIRNSSLWHELQQHPFWHRWIIRDQELLERRVKSSEIRLDLQMHYVCKQKRNQRLV